MPHIRRFSPMSTVPQELMHDMRSEQEPQKPQAKAEGQQTPEQARKTLGYGRISLHQWEPDTKHLLRTVFGVDPIIDPHTGQLIHPNSAGGVKVTPVTQPQ